MPTVGVYIRAEHAELWNSIPKKAEFLAWVLELYKSKELVFTPTKKETNEPSQTCSVSK